MTSGSRALQSTGSAEGRRASSVERPLASGHAESSSDQGVRARNRARMEAEILRLGREQLATRGPAALSLREIARDLGVASSAVYRYVADRDALLTRLLVDAYTDLADHVDTALADAPADRPARLSAFARAMRVWAVANPARWGLIYGTPVPGYTAPGEQTTAPGTRLMAALAGIVASGPMPGADPAGVYRDYLVAGSRDLGVDVAPAALAAAVAAWSMIVGAISTEVFGQLGPEVADVGEQVIDASVVLLLRGLTDV